MRAFTAQTRAELLLTARRGESVLLTIGMLFALTAISAVAAIQYPLS